MLPLVKAFLDIALLRRGPQDLPASPLLLYLALAAVLVSYVLAISPLHLLPQSLMRAVVDIGFIAAFVYLLLSVAGRRVRFAQTITALFGAGAVLGVAIGGRRLACQAGRLDPARGGGCVDRPETGNEDLGLGVRDVWRHGVLGSSGHRHRETKERSAQGTG